MYNEPKVGDTVKVYEYNGHYSLRESAVTAPFWSFLVQIVGGIIGILLSCGAIGLLSQIRRQEKAARYNY